MSDAVQPQAYRPLTIGQILERVSRLLRASLRTQLSIAVLPGIAFFLTYGVFFGIFALTLVPAVLKGDQHPAMPAVGVTFVAFACFLIAHLLVLALYMAAASYAAVMADCGIPATAGEAYAVAWRRAGHFIALLFSMYGICFFPALVLEAAIGMTMAGFTQTKEFSPVLIVIIPVAVLLLGAAAIAGVIVALRLSLAFPASVFEALNVRESFKHSWSLTRGALGRIFLTVLVIYAVLYVAMAVLMMAAMFVGAIAFILLSGVLAQPSQHATIVFAICGGALYLGVISAMSACSCMGFAASFSVIYNDQRMRMSLVNVSTAGAQG